MKKIVSLYLLTNISLVVFSRPQIAKAQISSGGTLSTTVSTDDAVNFLIENGDRSGSNLFHSFREFSLPNLGSAYFNNATDITNIFSRVTGGNISEIQGLLRANGTANLFLINPAGIVFGENASLDIGGSFFATTAESVVFGDGIEFSATQPQEAPLLTINITPSLQYGANPTSINVSGSNLVVNSGQSISLLGGDVVITNSRVTAPGGQINLGGLGETGTIQIEGLTATFPENTAFGNLNLTDTAIINVTSTSNGTIAINAADFTMSGNSEILAGLTSGGSNADAVAGNITINATGNTNLTEKSLIANDLQTNAVGNGGNIELNTNSLSVTEGSRIQTVTNSSGASGDISLNSNVAIVVDGFTDDGLFSGVLSRSATGTAGASGNITVDSPQDTLTLSNRGFIATVTNSSSDGGNIETNLNNLVIETGGQIVTATTNLGNAGDILINASESVNISGESRDFVPNPFLDLETFDLNTLEFITGFNANVAESETIPYVSVERTPEQIVSGTTIFGAAADQVDYYSFSVTQGGSRAILDIDEGLTREEDDVDTKIFLFNQGTGELLEVNDDSPANAGADGSIQVFGTLTADSLIDTTLSEPGFYVLGVAAFPSNTVNNQLVEGNSPLIGDTYILQASIENQGTQGVTIPIDPFNPDNYNPNVEAASGSFSESSGIGKGGNLTINTPQLIINDGGRLSTDNSGVGIGGDMTLNVDVIEISDLGLVSSTTRGSGDAGNILINTERLSQNNGSEISSVALNSGNAGSIQITATESIIVMSTNNQAISRIRSSVNGEAIGNGGLIKIETPLLQLLNGGQIVAATAGRGNGGEINIQANSIDIIGRINPFSSQIAVDTLSLGDGGNINIVTDLLRIADGGTINADSTMGTGNAGNININADSIFLDNQGSLQAEVTAGNQGNINLNSQFLLLRNNSNITTNAEEEATGGNIDIETVNLVALENSDITARAQFGRGGNILVTAQGLFLSLDSEFNASSEFGVDGVVTLNTPEADNSAALIQLPTDFTDPTQQISQGCAWTATSSFYVTGRGGIPQDPSGILPTQETLSDVRNSPNFPSPVVTENSSEIQSTIIEANTWIINEKGNVELVAIVTPQDPRYESLQASCAGK